MNFFRLFPLSFLFLVALSAARARAAEFRNPPYGWEQGHDTDSTVRHVSYAIEDSSSVTRPWAVVTSGPNITGKAEAVPIGSWYFNEYALFQKLSDAKYLGTPIQKFAVGLGHGLEFVAAVPTIPTEAANFFEKQQYLFKWQITADADTRRAFARPAVSVEPYFIVPQFGVGDYEQGLFALVHKRFEPFEFYAQAGDFLQDPSSSNGSPQIMDGNLFSYGSALEDVLNARHGAGIIVELYGQAQGNFSAFGKVNTPAFSFLSISPELEATWPNTKDFNITWNVGCFFPAYANNYPWQLIPQAQVQFFFNGIYGNAMEH